jgi:hypothetical protein
LEHIPTLNPLLRAKILASALAKQMSLSKGQLRPVLRICETVNICNSDCIFCPYSAQTRTRGTMSANLFATVINQYAAMGGGILSMTPMVDILLDNLLISRLDALENVRSEITPSVTTNLFALDKWSDDEVGRLLRGLTLLHVSIYGVTAEENVAITRRQNFQKFVANCRRLMRIWENFGRPCELKLGFRNAYDHSSDRLAGFVNDVFGVSIPFHATHVYANWGDSVSGALPGDAQWMTSRENSSPCILLAAALQVYWDGPVSACAYCDYDASKELQLGSITEHTLTELYNGAAADELWHQHFSGSMPGICKHCTFHAPFDSVDTNHPLVRSPLTFIGG